MSFLKPTFGMVAPSLLVVALAVVPFQLLRHTVYALLAIPLWPIIQRFGWVYSDKPWFLTYPATVFTALFWSAVLYLILCTARRMRQRFVRTSYEKRGSSKPKPAPNDYGESDQTQDFTS